MNGLEDQGRIWEMVTGAGPAVKLVLLILLLLSIFSWAIIFYKMNVLRKMERETRSFYNLFSKTADLNQLLAASKNYPATPLSRLFMACSGVIEMTGNTNQSRAGAIEYAKRVLKKTAANELASLEKSVTFLATTGNTAPFIGLFGTVWGIMTTFRHIGYKGSASLAVVAPGIAEALIATAMGLVAAIPAVVGYNHILSRTDRVSKEMDGFSADLINLLEKRLSAAEPKGGA